MDFCAKKFSSFSFFLLFSLIAVTLYSQKIRITTSVGNIDLELYGEKAPITTANFLQYIDEKAYDGASFYRAVRDDNSKPSQPFIEVIQGGLDSDSTKRRDPIVLERTNVTGVKHLDGTISMARSAPNSGSSEIFICINDQPSLDFGGLRNPDGQGFAAFGKVTKGMKVVKKIQYQKTTLYPSLGLNQRITNPIKILKIRRL
jgi:peptidyl-prolyl cis-trans isomerase A (cyclophilin A)